MMADVLRDRVREHKPENAVEQENALTELIQQLVLASLSRAGFFSTGVFHGGTCLRILHGTSRFSEDLDFMLRQPDPHFRWEPYLQRVRGDCQADEIDLEVQDKSRANTTVQKAFLRAEVIVPGLRYPRPRGKKTRIKLEVDANPPAGSCFESRYIAFPITAAITTQDLASGFATKSHALLCRAYTKGRDWYDFIWYVSKRVVPELPLLGNALHQLGPWAGQGVQVTPGWYVEALRARIEQIDWDSAKADVARFIPSKEQHSLSLWNRGLFFFHLDRLAEYVGESPPAEPAAFDS